MNAPTVAAATSPFRSILAASIGLLLAAAPAGAANLFWDGSAVAVDGVSAGGTGLWAVGSPGWEDSASAVNWTNGNDAAVTSLTASTLTLTGTVAANSLTVAAGGTGTALVRTDGTAGRTVTLANGAAISGGTLQFGDSTAAGTTGRLNLRLGGNLTGPGQLAISKGVTVTSLDASPRTISANLKLLVGDGTAALYLDSTTSGAITISGLVEADGNGRGISVIGQAYLTGGVSTTGTNSFTKVGSGTLTVTGSGINYAGTATQTITGIGTLEIAGSATMTGGAVAGTFANNIPNSGTLRINTTASQIISGQITGAGALVKDNTGTLTLTTNSTFNGGTTVNGGVLDLAGTANAGNGKIRGTVTVNGGATLRLSAGDATGYTAGSQLSTINLVGGTLQLNTTANQTFGSATVNLTGGALTGIDGSNFDLLGGTSAINTLASAVTSTISTPTFNLRQNDSVFTVADGAAETDLSITSAIGNGSGATNHSLIKSGAGKLALLGANVFTGDLTIDQGTVQVSGTGRLYKAALTNTPTVQINAAGTLALESFSSGGSLGLLPADRQRRVLNGGTLQVTGATQASGNNFTVNAAGGTFEYTPADETLSLTGNASTDIQLDGQLSLGGAGNIAVSETMAGAGGLTKFGAGTVTLSGAQPYTGPTTVSAGTLVAGGSLSGTAGLALSNTGTLLLGNSDALNPAATVTLGGGTFGTGGYSLGSAATSGLATLTLTASSTLDFNDAATGGSQLWLTAPGAHTAGSTLSILNYNGSPNRLGGSGDDRLIFAGANPTAFTSLFGQNDISFNGVPGYAAVEFADQTHYEIVPIPEPASAQLLGAFSLLGLISYRERDRLRRRPGVARA